MSSAELFSVVRSGDAAAVTRLIESDPALLQSSNEQGVSAVLMACYTGRNEIRDLLIARGASLQLHEAAAAGHLARVRELVEANPAAANHYSPDGFPIVALAAVFNHEEVARYLHSKGADLNAVATNGSGYTALSGAVASGHASVSKWLAENGANVNYTYANNYSALLTAAANGHLEIVKMLLAHGADLQSRTTDGKNALAYAQERNHPEVAEYLRRLGLS